MLHSAIQHHIWRRFVSYPNHIVVSSLFSGKNHKNTLRMNIDRLCARDDRPGVGCAVDREERIGNKIFLCTGNSCRSQMAEG
jgi:hypothetical protein